MPKQTIYILSLSLLIMWSCKKDDQSSEQVNLLFTENNLAGDWKRIAEFRGQPNDSLGILEPLEDLLAQFENCRKDDILRYVKGNEQEDNPYFWGIGAIACHSQISKTFTEIGTWSLEESGKLSHVNSNRSEYHIVIQLNAQQLLVRIESDKNENSETTFEFTEYERIR
ncbi:hypothetical protein [Maribacter cobaltidurans]|jgi:hypothetical protein|uniref:Uncharacterized protein n=1 Tax=Maribacter cobaltidurans TaxID=1178778 RepID=A0A223V613_9FLAO|nr:hypothetical protein [Maribacter cobaltidurans]ASV30853.1 hypothetical protein CJ263_11845 [Maribacter cobaltidurans]GGD89152.1 hypothetical protein GCM10011412_28800 [Maribacter cobaltidurans]